MTHRDTFGGVSTLPNSLLRDLVSRDWPLVYLELLAQCPEVEDRQGTAALAALETPKGLASLSAPLRFRAEETERCTSWRPLRPGPLAGLADRSPEGTEDRRATCNVVYPALPQRGHGIRTASEASYWKQRSSDTHHLLGRLLEPESAQAGPNETRLAGAPTPPGVLLMKPVLRD